MRLRLADGTLWELKYWSKFWSKVDATGDCWEWIGAKFPNHYGLFSNHTMAPPRKTWAAHRLSWQILIGPIRPKMTLDHLCRNRACINPAHLDQVSRGENVLRGYGSSAQAARSTHCKWGHAWTPENTHITKRGNRHCRACHRQYWRDRQARLRESSQ